MLITSGAVSSDFFVFFDFEAGFGELVAFKADFEAGFGELVAFEPWVPHLEPIGGIKMTNLSHLAMKCCNFGQETAK